MESEIIGRFIGVSFAFTLFVFITYNWIKEFKFYKRNGWDFELDSKCLTMFWGDSDHAKMTNAARLKKGYPFFFILSVGMFLGSMFG